MIELKINNKVLKVPEGTSVLKAAESLDISIPSMCFLDGYDNHPSCMVCLVKDAKNGNLFPSCAMKVQNGMEIITDDDEVFQARKEALELLMSDHVGDCDAPCQLSCPAYMDIPLMNRLIGKGEFHEALKIVKEEIALPYVLGYICPAPCEKACKRKQIDKPVSICLLKRFVAEEDINSEEIFFPKKNVSTGKKIAIIGAGPAGLACAFYILKEGYSCVIYDDNTKVGGSLLDIVSPEEFPAQVIEKEADLLKEYGVQFELSTLVDKKFLDENITGKFDAIVFASGKNGGSLLQDLNIDVKSINTNTFHIDNTSFFACGSILKEQKMAIRAVAQGRTTAVSVDSFLHKEEFAGNKRLFNSKFGKLKNEELEEYLKESVNDNRIEPSQGFLEGFNKEEAIKEAQRCLHCDCRKPATCKLRLYSGEYQVDRKRFLFGERKTIIKFFHHENVVYEPQKCIKCSLCIDITSKEKELTGLTHIGRGFDIRIDIPFNNTLDKALTKAAIKCVEACPTGAIALKKD